MAEKPSLEQLMQLSQKGDNQAYAAFLKEVSIKLRPMLISRAGENAEDVLQEILVSIHKARHTYDTDRAIMPWVNAIARFRLNDFLRRKYKLSQEVGGDGEWLENLSNDDDVTETLAWSESLKKTLTQLPEKQQKVIQLMYFEDLSVKEISHQLDMGESAVKVTAHRGYKTLRKLLEKET